MARILSIDPGEHPGYALLNTDTLIHRKYFRRALPQVVGLWLARPSVAADVCTVELQWLTGPKRKRAVLTLAFTAGWQLCAACAATGGLPERIHVDDWREALDVGKATKRVVCNRVEQSLTPIEAALIPPCRPARLRDLYDAIAIGWATYLRLRGASTC